MAITFTFHGPERASDGAGSKADALGRQIGNRVAVANGAASSALTASGWYRICATTASYVKIDSAATDGSNGEEWPAGQVEVRWIAEGDKIGASAA